VIGGAAGAVPPLAGWAAGAGHLDPLAFILFAIIFFWTPPHFWALALLIKRDYDSVGVPMLPVTRGDTYTVRRIVAYAVLTVAITVTPWVFGMLGLAYLATALVLGGTFVALTIRLWANPSKRAAGLVFHFSLLYLALLFVAVAVGATLT
jgi:protoheme IX farnesyltransferase